MTLHTPSTQTVGSTMTRIGSGVAAALFVTTAALLVPALVAAAVMASTHIGPRWSGRLTSSHLAVDAAALTGAGLIASLALVALGRRLQDADHAA